MKKSNHSLKKRLLVGGATISIVFSFFIAAWYFLPETYFVLVLIGSAIIFAIIDSFIRRGR